MYNRQLLVGILAEHYPHPVFGCECMPTNEDGTTQHLDISWSEHLATLVEAALDDRTGLSIYMFNDHVGLQFWGSATPEKEERLMTGMGAIKRVAERSDRPRHYTPETIFFFANDEEVRAAEKTSN